MGKHSPPKETMNGVANEPKISVQVLVLGDIGRSPRMQYHAMSIAKHGGRVDMIGYQESTLHPGLIDNPLVSIVPLPPPPPILRANKLPFVIAGPFLQRIPETQQYAQDILAGRTKLLV